MGPQIYIYIYIYIHVHIVLGAYIFNYMWYTKYHAAATLCVRPYA